MLSDEVIKGALEILLSGWAGSYTSVGAQVRCPTLMRAGSLVAKSACHCSHCWRPVVTLSLSCTVLILPALTTCAQPTPCVSPLPTLCPVVGLVQDHHDLCWGEEFMQRVSHPRCLYESKPREASWHLAVPTAADLPSKAFCLPCSA